jgi:hypothetical protein
MAVERILVEGEDVAGVMASYGFYRTTAYKWLAKARGHGKPEAPGVSLADRHGERSEGG